jgi:DNA mismatch repair ATPase MutS
MGLARMGHVTAVVTTHYADMVRLAHDDPTAFVNVSMEAKVAPNGDSIHFPYILRSGSSFQSIALELMRIRGMFPDAFIDDALKLKEKIGHNEVVSKI